MALFIGQLPMTRSFLDTDIKVLCQLLAKLHIPDKPASLGLLCLGTLLEHVIEVRPSQFCFFFCR